VRGKLVNVHEAKTHLSRLLERAHRGEEIILAKGGKPYARLVPLEDSVPREPGAMKGRWNITDAFFEPLPEEELDAWNDGSSSGNEHDPRPRDHGPAECSLGVGDCDEAPVGKAARSTDDSR
jgi:prevent-host-death family protein